MRGWGIRKSNMCLFRHIDRRLLYRGRVAVVCRTPTHIPALRLEGDQGMLRRVSATLERGA